MPAAMKKSVPSKSIARKQAQGAADPIELPEGMFARIAAKAYELWEARGRRNGHDLQDWLDAEQIVMDEIHETRE
jgi:Protein of unknown function (DUF2934)